MRTVTPADKRRYAGIYFAYITRLDISYATLSDKLELTRGRICQIIGYVDAQLRTNFRVSGLPRRPIDPARAEMLRNRLQQWALGEVKNGK
jgi:hypothetical protein